MELHACVVSAGWMDGVHLMELHTCVSTGWMGGVHWMDGWSPLDGTTRLCGVCWMDGWMDGWSPLDGSTRLCGVCWMDGWMDGVH